MTSNATQFLAVTAIAVAGSLIGSSALAQVYRIVGPDGKVTFSDQPPPASSTSKVVPGAGSGGGGSGSTLPFELRQVANKYPVTLYTSDNCGPCVSARTMLSSRGVPFAEKTVNTNEDLQALQRLSGENSLPFATVGSQQLKGYSDAEWTQFLDAAGYPKSSTLPANYRQQPATPLVAASTAPAAAPAQAARPAAPRAVQPAPAPTADNPAGIKF